MLGKGKKQEGEAAAAKGGERGLTVMKLNLPAIVMVVLVVVVSGYVAYLQYASLVKKAQQVQHVADADKLAALLGGRLVALGDQIARQGRVGTEIANAIKTGNSDVLRLFERGLKSYFPDALRVKVVLPTDTDPDLSTRPPLGYACLDLARQAEAGTGRPPMELHLHGLEHAHLDIVRPVVSSGEIIASLMVSFPPDKVAEWLADLPLQQGYIELQQGWEGPVIGAIGVASLKSGNPAHRTVISGSSWQLTYWVSEGIGMAEAKKAGFLVTIGIAVALIAAIMIMYSLFLSATIKRELRNMAEFMLASSRGERFHSYPVKMVEMEEALQMMEPVLHASKPNEGIKEKAEEGDGGVSDMMFMDFGEITVEESEGEVPPQGDNNKP